jgi:hypothetical protein
MSGNAIRSVQELGEPIGLSLALLLDVFPALSSTYHGTNGDNENGEPFMTLIGRMKGSRIG